MKLRTSFRAIQHHARSFGLQAFPAPLDVEENTGSVPSAIVYVELYEGGDPKHGDLVFDLRVEQTDLEVDEIEVDLTYPARRHGEGSLAEHFVQTLGQ